MTENSVKSRFLEKLVLVVAGGASIRDAAEQVGCSEDHAGRIARTDEFKTRLAELRNQVVSEVLGRLIDASRRAVDVLNTLMESPSEAIRLKAASAVLSSLTNIHANIEQRNQIESLEQRIEEYERQRDAA